MKKIYKNLTSILAVLVLVLSSFFFLGKPVSNVVADEPTGKFAVITIQYLTENGEKLREPDVVKLDAMPADGNLPINHQQVKGYNRVRVDQPQFVTSAVPYQIVVKGYFAKISDPKGEYTLSDTSLGKEYQFYDITTSGGRHLVSDSSKSQLPVTSLDFNLSINDNPVWCFDPLTGTYDGAQYNSFDAEENVYAAFLTNYVHTKYNDSKLARAMAQKLLWENQGFRFDTSGSGKLQIIEGQNIRNEFNAEETALLTDLKTEAQKFTDYYKTQVANGPLTATTTEEGYDATTSTLTVKKSQAGSTVEFTLDAEKTKLFLNGAVNLPDTWLVQVTTEGKIRVTIPTDVEVGHTYDLGFSIVGERAVGTTVGYRSTASRPNQELRSYKIKDPKYNYLHITVIDDPKGSVAVMKKDAEDNKPLAGVTFELRKGEEKVAEAITDANGELTFENVAYGEYELVETKAKEGYVLDSTPQAVVINADTEIVVKEITNAKIKGIVRIYKSDKLDGKPLEGVTFELRKDGEKVKEGVTDANGELQFSDVPYGDYQVVETKAKEGYVLSKDTEFVSVTENGTKYTAQFINEKIVGSIKVVKKDADDNSKLSGVRFDLVKDGDVLASRTTNQDGEILFADIDYGTYTLVEKQAKDGYVLNAEPQEVEIREHKIVVTKEITNTKFKGNIKVIKTDVEDNSKLAGVQFELRKDGQAVQVGTTDANGEIIFENVLLGTYQLVETKAKDGYVLNTEPQEVTVSENGEVVEKVITNKKEPVKPEQPKVEEPKPNPIKPKDNVKPKEKLKEKVDTNDNTSMATMMLLFVSSALLLYRRKK